MARALYYLDTLHEVLVGFGGVELHNYIIGCPVRVIVWFTDFLFFMEGSGGELCF